MRVALVALLLAGCASTDAYERGVNAPARQPASTYTPAGAGAPEPGQPGYIRRGLPRSDSRRQVQPREDGQPQMMAADGDDERAIRLMFTAPVTATPPGISPGAHRKCFKEMMDGAGRIVGRYNQHEFDEAIAGRRSEKVCGRNLEYYTDRVGDLMREMCERGDDDLGWRNP